MYCELKFIVICFVRTRDAFEVDASYHAVATRLVASATVLSIRCWYCLRFGHLATVACPEHG